LTTIVFRDGILAADSRATIQTEAGGSRVFRCEKLYRKTIGTGRKRHEVILGLAGESTPALLFVDWYGSDKPPPQVFADMVSDFSVLIYSKHGLFEADAYCRPERVIEKFWAIGSGAKAALGAMHAGADARKACSIACRIDPYSAPPIVTMALR
jgi:hypothetical protein